MKKSMIEELLKHPNSVWPTIKFTVELEKDGTLPFLDTHLWRKEDGSLDIIVYRKPTHTNRYPHFQFHHPAYVRRGLVRCLYNKDI